MRQSKLFLKAKTRTMLVCLGWLYDNNSSINESKYF